MDALPKGSEHTVNSSHENIVSENMPLYEGGRDRLNEDCSYGFSSGCEMKAEC